MAANTTKHSVGVSDVIIDVLTNSFADSITTARALRQDAGVAKTCIALSGYVRIPVESSACRSASCVAFAATSRG